MFVLKKRLPYPDVQSYLDTMKRNFGGIFFPHREICIVRAPGRLDVMGGIAEHMGSLVLTSTVQEAVVLGLQKRTDRKILVRSIGIEEHGFALTLESSLDDLFGKDRPKAYSVMRRFVHKDPARSWLGYLAGSFLVLLKEHLVDPFECGVNIGLQSAVPMGMGVASSAALTIACMFAITRAFNIALTENDIITLCQIVESQIVGKNTGSADLLTSLMGERDELLAVNCQPNEMMGKFKFPQGYRLAGINTMVRHRRAPARDELVRTAMNIGRTIILDYVRGTEEEENPFGGYICNLTSDEFAASFEELLPGRITGKEVQETFNIANNKSISIEADASYRVRSCTKHAIGENERAHAFVKHLNDPALDDGEKMRLIGELMYASHESYGKNCGLGTREADLLVSLVRERGSGQGLFGARMTGGGSGGTVAVLARTDTDDVVQNIGAQYCDATGITPQLLLYSSPGALAFGSFTASFD